MGLEKFLRRGIAVTFLAASLGAMSVGGCEKECPTCPQVEDPVDPPVDPPIFTPLPTNFFNDKATRWIDYAPTNFNPNASVFPSEESIREDLRTLKAANFYAIVTYGSDNILGQVPRIAKEEGMRYVVEGIWNPTNTEEITNALAMSPYVDGYVVGNEGIGARYTLEELKTAIDSLRDSTDKPVTTTEIVDNYDSVLIAIGDWIFPNAHPYWNGIKIPSVAADWTVQKYDDLDALTDKRVVIKETGLPTEGEAGLNETVQNEFYRALEALNKTNNTNTFVYFEAFDQPWKNSMPVEPHWGFFNSDRTHKEVSEPQIVLTYVPARYTNENLLGDALNVKPSDYRVAVHILVRGTWWSKPYFATPLTGINSTGNWITDITTGGVDSEANRISAYLVTPSYVPDGHAIPVVDGTNVITGKIVDR